MDRCNRTGQLIVEKAEIQHNFSHEITISLFTSGQTIYSSSPGILLSWCVYGPCDSLLLSQPKEPEHLTRRQDHNYQVSTRNRKFLGIWYHLARILFSLLLCRHLTKFSLSDMAVSVLAGFGVYEVIGFITAQCLKEQEANPGMQLNCSFTRTAGFDIAFIAYPTGILFQFI